MAVWIEHTLTFTQVSAVCVLHDTKRNQNYVCYVLS